MHEQSCVTHSLLERYLHGKCDKKRPELACIAHMATFRECDMTRQNTPKQDLFVMTHYSPEKVV